MAILLSNWADGMEAIRRWRVYPTSARAVLFVVEQMEIFAG
jgi:hypothetical protein